MITDNMKKLSSSSKRKAKGDPSDINGYLGPWAGYEGEDLTKDEIQGLSQLDAERLDAQAAADDAEAKRKAAAAEEAMMTGSETSTFHGSSLLDYLGRTYMHVPTDTDSGVNLRGEPGTQECFLPKKHLHTWTGHTKGVNAIRFFPNSAHLLLSASMDNTVKLWDVYNERRCLRTFNGHYKGVKDICFSNDGKTFLTCSYDKMIKLWDTESGKKGEGV